MQTFIGVFSTTSDETKSTKAKFCREELARVRPDGIHQEFALQLEFALAVNLGVHLTRATYLLEGDDMLVGNCSLSNLPSAFRPPVFPKCFYFYFFSGKMSQCRPRELCFHGIGLFSNISLITPTTLAQFHFPRLVRPVVCIIWRMKPSSGCAWGLH